MRARTKTLNPIRILRKNGGFAGVISMWPGFKKLGDEHRRLFEETTSLQAEVLKLSRLGRVVKLGKIVIPCRVCGRESVFVKLHTASEYRGMMSSGGVLQYRCFNCGQWGVYTSWDILTVVGLLAAPEQLKEAQTPHAKD